MFHLSSLNALSFVRFSFNGIANAKCIIVPLMLNVVFLVYANFMIFGFKGSTFVICLIYYRSMFCIIHMRVNIFTIPAPPIRKTWNDFVRFLTFWYKISSIIVFCSLFNCVICEKKSLYAMNSSIHWETLCVNNLFLTFFLFDCVKFSYDTSYGSISLVLVNNIFLCGLLTLSIISFETKISHPFVWWIFVYFLTYDFKLSIQSQNCWMG